jgi:phosphoglycerate dehydrogenase-like enzyme
MPKLLVTQPSVTGVDDPHLEVLRAAGWEIRYEPSGARATPDELLEMVQGHDAVIASSEKYTRAVLEGADTLKHVARWGVGFDQVDVPAATELGILVTTTVGANDWGVADHAFALMFALGRRVVENDAIVRQGGWSRPAGRDIWRKTLGVV